MQRFVYTITAVLALLSSFTAFAQVEDMRWQGFHLRDVNGPVYTIVKGPDNALYIGGSFTEAGGVAASNIVRWHKGVWEALGSGVSGGNTPAVYAIAVTPSGVIAGGTFGVIGEQAANNIARWNGAKWNPLGSGTNDIVYALAFGSNATLYVGGKFSIAGGISGNAVAQWTEGEWKSVGNGVKGANREIRSLLFRNNTLYAGGHFTHAGDIEALNIAQWNESGWQPLGAGIPPYEAIVYSLAMRDSALYASGFFSEPAAQKGTHVLAWDGALWTAQATCNGAVRSIAFLADGTLAAAGEFTEVYNATNASVQAQYIALRTTNQWQAVHGGMDKAINTLALTEDNMLIAGGDFNIAGSNVANYIARLAPENTWSTLDSPQSTSVNGTIHAAVTAPNGDLYIGGSFTIAGTTTANAIARWDGNHWHSLGKGIQGTVYAITIDKDGMVYAGGQFGQAGATTANAIAQWDGNQWLSLNSNLSYARVFALTVNDAGTLYAGGQFAQIGSTKANRVARWDGSTWSAMNSGVDGAVYAIVWKQGRLYIGGEFIVTAGATLNGIAEWNGAKWSPIQEGVKGSVFALTVDNKGNLYAAGDFAISQSNANKIAMWNGNRWLPLGSGMNHDITALALDSSGKLYAAGYFSIAGNKNTSNIAVWEANEWNPLGSGVDTPPRALAATTDALYVAGSMRSAGNQSTHNVARWKLCNFAPAIVPDGPINICWGASTTLSAPEGFASYQWNTGATTPSITVAEGGTYSVTITEHGGCVEQASVVVTVATVPLASPPAFALCAGDSVRIVVNGAQSYVWEPSPSLSCSTCESPWAYPTTTTTYTVTATNNNCTTTATVLVKVLPPATKPSITVKDVVLISTPAETYQWLLSGIPVVGAISQTYTVDTPGIYAVQISDTKGCTATSDPVEVAVHTSVVIEPFAMSSSIHYHLDGNHVVVEHTAASPVELTINILDITGRTVYQQHLPRAAQHTIPINLNIATGVYLLVVESGTDKYMRPLLIP